MVPGRVLGLRRRQEAAFGTGCVGAEAAEA